MKWRIEVKAVGTNATLSSVGQAAARGFLGDVGGFGAFGAAAALSGRMDGSPMVITVGTPVGMPDVSFNISRSVGPSIN